MRRPFALPRCGCLAALTLAVVVFSPAGNAAAVSYGVDEHSGSIEFLTRGLGLLPVHGHFGHFMGRLDFDPQNLARTRIDVEVDAGGIESPWPGIAPRLRSMAYFDAATFPHVLFRSTAVALGAPGHFTLTGILTIRGIERPQQLDVTAMQGGSGGADGAVAEIVATGSLNRSEFGMVADDGLVSDTVRLTITSRIRLPPGAFIPGPRSAGSA